MFHREVYGLLRNVPSEQMQTPIKFLDIACGDAIVGIANDHGPKSARRRSRLSGGHSFLES
jgi:hypothetical protein